VISRMIKRIASPTRSHSASTAATSRSACDIFRVTVDTEILDIAQSTTRSHLLHSQTKTRVVRCVRIIAKKRLLVLSCLSVRPSVNMEQFGSHWVYFHEI
jgi:hypothetical protein